MRSSCITQRRGDACDRAEQRRLGCFVACRGSGEAARPGSRSSDRRTDYAGARSAARRVGGRAARRSATISSTAATVRACSAAIGSQSRSSETSVRYSRAISMLDFASVISRLCTSVRKKRPVAVEAAELAGVRTHEGRPAAVPRGQHAAVLRPGEHPWDRAERCEILRTIGPAGRPRADVHQRELVDRREGTEEVDEPLVVDERRGTPRTSCRRARQRRPRRPRAGRRPFARARRRACVAASDASRLRYASPGSPYLNAIVSPCSVTFSRPGGSPCGCARIASYVGPPPRPALPPRPWKTVSSTPRARATSASATSARRISHWALEIAGVLRRVGVADHHLTAPDRVEQLAVDARRSAKRVDRLEERDDRQRLVRQLVHAAHVVRRVGARDDPGVERLRPMPPTGFDNGVGHAADALVGIHEVARVGAHVELGEVQPEDLDTSP